MQALFSKQERNFPSLKNKQNDDGTLYLQPFAVGFQEHTFHGFQPE